MSVSASGAPPLRPRLNVAGGACCRSELGQIGELKFMCADMGDPTVLQVGGRGALVNGNLDDLIAFRDTLAAATLASLSPMRAVKDPVYLVVEVATCDELPDVWGVGRTCTLCWGRRPLLLRQRCT